MVILLSAVAVLLFVSSCGKWGNAPIVGKDDAIMPGITQEQPQTVEAKSEQPVAIGEKVNAVDANMGEVIPDALIYTVNGASLFSDAVEAGIGSESMAAYIEGGVLDDGGNPRTGVKFLLVEMSVQNIRAVSERNISSVEVLCMAQSDTESDLSAESEFFEMPAPAYFSNPSGVKNADGEWKDYYSYSLPVGQTKNLKVGWYVDLANYRQSDLVLAFNRGLPEYVRFVDLGL
jgi:hypothetical protein